MRNRSENQITLVLIRHGKTKSNEEQRYLGKTEEALSEKGKKEVLEYKTAQGYPAVDCLFSSPMERCLQTAKLIYPELEPVCIPEWKEIDFGAFEGKNYQELKEDKRYQEWIDKNGALPFPQGESRESFIRRCEKGYQRMLKEIAEMKKYSMDMGNNEIEGRRGKKTIGMIVHGGTIMALLSQYGDEDYFDYQTANGRGYICTWTKENGKAVFTDIRKL